MQSASSNQQTIERQYDSNLQVLDYNNRYLEVVFYLINPLTSKLMSYKIIISWGCWTDRQIVILLRTVAVLYVSVCTCMCKYEKYADYKRYECHVCYEYFEITSILNERYNETCISRL